MKPHQQLKTLVNAVFWWVPALFMAVFLWIPFLYLLMTDNEPYTEYDSHYLYDDYDPLPD